jgi:threonine synthase
LFACPHTGVALAALFKLVTRGEIQATDRVVVVSTAHGLKFTDFKVGYHNASLQGVEARYRNPPIELEADYAAVSEAINRQIEIR